MNLVRRKLLGGAASVATIGLFGGVSAAYASAEDVSAAIKVFAGDAEVGTGTVTLITPEIAENGNSVPVSVSVESPMTEDDYVESVMILAEGNPSPEVVTFNFTSASGVAKAPIPLSEPKDSTPALAVIPAN